MGKFLDQDRGPLLKNSLLTYSQIRICKPAGSGGWVNVAPLGVPCDGGSTEFSADETGLEDTFSVTNSQGCDAGSSDLTGTLLTYKGESIAPQTDSRCGDRDHGITCEFSM